MQGVHLFATIGISMAVSIFAGCCVNGVIPSVAVESHNGGITMYGMIDSEVKCIHLSAAVRILVAISVITTGDVFCPIPSIALACGIRNSGVFGGVDGQVKGIHLGATVGICMSVEISAAVGDCGVASANPAPDVALALCHSKDIVHRVVDGEVEGVHLSATVGICMSVEISAAVGDGDVSSACLVPGVCLAGNLSVMLVDRVVDGEVEGVSTGTILTIVVMMDIGSALGVGLTCSSSPGVCLAFGDGGCIVRTIVDGQVQGINLDAVVAVYGVHVITADIVSLSSPCVPVASIRSKSKVRGMVDGQVQNMQRILHNILACMV